MKKISLATIITVFVSLSAVFLAQSVETPIVGFQSVPISVGMNSISAPFVSPVTSASVSSNSVSSVFLAGGFGVGNSLNSSDNYYLLVKTGSLAGERFEVDVAATKAGSAVVISTSSPLNTAALTQDAVINQQVSVNKHLRSSDLAGYLSSSPTTATSISNSDSFGFYEDGALTFYYARPDGSFKRIGSPEDFKNKLALPGSGVLYRRVSSTNNFTTTGTVSTTPFARNYSIGAQIVAPAFPADSSTTEFGIVPGSGASDWTGGTSASTGDFVPRVENGALVRYSLRTDGSLRRVGFPDDFRNSTILNSGEAVIVHRQKAASDVLQTSPVSN
jgi:hypothetical protein